MGGGGRGRSNCPSNAPIVFSPQLRRSTSPSNFFPLHVSFVAYIFHLILSFHRCPTPPFALLIQPGYAPNPTAGEEDLDGEGSRRGGRGRSRKEDRTAIPGREETAMGAVRGGDP